MLVDRMVVRARSCLRSVELECPVSAVLPLLSERHIDLVAVCCDGALAGVVTKTDIIASLMFENAASLLLPVSSVMSANVVSCRPSEKLLDVWARARARGLRHIPIVDEQNRPLGVLRAEDALQLLLREVAIEDEQLRLYIAGAGYQ